MSERVIHYTQKVEGSDDALCNIHYSDIFTTDKVHKITCTDCIKMVERAIDNYIGDNQ